MEIIVLVFWIGVAIAVGAVASSKGRSGTGWFFLSLLISPIIALLILLCLNSNQPVTVEPPTATKPLIVQRVWQAGDNFRFGDKEYVVKETLNNGPSTPTVFLVATTEEGELQFPVEGAVFFKPLTEDEVRAKAQEREKEQRAAAIKEQQREQTEAAFKKWKEKQQKKESRGTIILVGVGVILVALLVVVSKTTSPAPALPPVAQPTQPFEPAGYKPTMPKKSRTSSSRVTSQTKPVTVPAECADRPDGESLHDCNARIAAQERDKLPWCKDVQKANGSYPSCKY